MPQLDPSQDAHPRQAQPECSSGCVHQGHQTHIEQPPGNRETGETRQREARQVMKRGPVGE